jgi:hypothetical protein
MTTHIFDPDDPYIESDAVFGVKESSLAEFKKIDDPAREGTWLKGEVLRRRARFRAGI